MLRRWIGIWTCGLLAGAGAVEKDQPQAQELAPTRRMAVDFELPAATSSASIVPQGNRPSMPPMQPRVAIRAPKSVAVKEPAKVEDLPPVVRTQKSAKRGESDSGAAEMRPQFEQPGRIVITAAPGLMPRIPELLPSNRRSRLSEKQVILTADPVSSAAVANLQGTSELAPLPPLLREMEIEVAPSPGVLPFDKAPYVQSANSPDDEDAPVLGSRGLPGRMVMK